MTIRVLPSSVANQIAAGEVVERPASVVKELIENSLDAGANEIVVEIEQGGISLIRVADNGIGIPSAEVQLAFERYATSKLWELSDLLHLNSLGFRGEALASIASVSQVTVMTRHAGEEAGTRLKLEAGAITDSGLIGAPQGTIITVENLFYNVPARLKFLKKEVTERRYITAIVSRYAMAYPSVRFVLRHGQREVLHTTGSDNLQEVLGEVFGTDVAAQMVPIEQDDRQQREDLPNIQVSGYVGLPGLNRSNRNQITLFVNGRWIQDQSLAYAVIQAYHTMLMVGRYPVAVIMVSLPPEEVDVNVHPAKAEVRFREPDAVFSAVQRTVRRTLIEKAPPQAVRQEISWGNPEWAVRRERLSQVTSERLKQLNIDMPIEGPGQHRKQYETDYSRPEAEENTRPVRTLPMLRVVGQIGATYIVTEGPTGMYLIDQHAAHERVLYEQFMAETSGKHQHSQELLEAVVIELSAEQMLLIEDSLDLLINAGFRVEPFGRNAVQVRALPMIIAHEEPGEALLAAIGEIECGSMPVEATAEEQLIARVCKRAAIKAGQVLSLPEMEALVRHLEQCQSPQTCPHGRPTMLHLSADQLAREFGRLGAI